MRRTLLCTLCVLMCMALSACTAAPSAQPTPASTRTPSQALMGTCTPDPAEADTLPDVSRDIPAYQPDVETPLSYEYNGAVQTIDGLRHYSVQGYSIVYDPNLFTRQGWENGDSYWASQGNYLSVSRLNGMDAVTLRQGLILQEEIPDLGQQTQVGGEKYTAHTLVVSPQDGVYRQFWILELGANSSLLVEQSCVMEDPDTAQFQAIQKAMLDTLTLE